MTKQNCQCTLQLFPEVQFWDKLCKYISHTRIIWLKKGEIFWSKGVLKWTPLQTFKPETYHMLCYGLSLLFLKIPQGLHTLFHLYCETQSRLKIIYNFIERDIRRNKCNKNHLWSFFPSKDNILRSWICSHGAGTLW